MYDDFRCDLSHFNVGLSVDDLFEFSPISRLDLFVLLEFSPISMLDPF